MKTLYIEKSTGSCRDGNWAAELDLEGVERIVVGTGPGSFAGIRAAIAFANGYRLATGCEVVGLPSACALAVSEGPSAVVGDARRGMYWVALFDGFKLIGEIFQVTKDELPRRVPRSVPVTSPDAARIGEMLKEMFGDFYDGGRLPTAEGLRRFAEANPAALKSEPLPVYLNAAVRD
jgi:tRNA threonylcarbamoyl adenosine modification protein YeaZ